MCSCDFGFVCARCAERWPLDSNPYHVDWSEQELEARNTDVSRIDFESPYTEAA